MKGHVEISLEWERNQVDLSIPSFLSAHQVVDLISRSFEEKGEFLPNNWHFIVKGKQISLETGLSIDEIGVANGDILKIVLGEWNEII